MTSRTFTISTPASPPRGASAWSRSNASSSRLTSAWRRTIASQDAAVAVGLAGSSAEFQKLASASPQRPSYLGDLEAVSWTPPCESQHTRWTLDVWYLLAFDGRIGTGRSFLCDLEANQVIAVRDFSVRTS